MIGFDHFSRARTRRNEAFVSRPSSIGRKHLLFITPKPAKSCHPLRNKSSDQTNIAMRIAGLSWNSVTLGDTSRYFQAVRMQVLFFKFGVEQRLSGRESFPATDSPQGA
jgi:hypothetical protein